MSEQWVFKVFQPSKARAWSIIKGDLSLEIDHCENGLSINTYYRDQGITVILDRTEVLGLYELILGYLDIGELPDRLNVKPRLREIE